MTEKNEIIKTETRWNNGNLQSIEYRLNGKLHNPNGPALRKFFEDEEIKVIEYRLNGKSHNLNGPAYEEYYENGNLRFRHHYLKGRLHNHDGPAFERYYGNGAPRYKAYFLNGELHNSDGPAHEGFDEDGIVKWSAYWLNGKRGDREVVMTDKIIKTETRWDNGNLKSIKYELDGLLHNPNGPALMRFFENEIAESMEFRLNGKFHNSDGPALEVRHGNGAPKLKAYYLNGKFHNSYGPAVEGFDEDGNVEWSDYYLYDKEVTKGEVMTEGKVMTDKIIKTETRYDNGALKSVEWKRIPFEDNPRDTHVVGYLGVDPDSTIPAEPGTDKNNEIVEESEPLTEALGDHRNWEGKVLKVEPIQGILDTAYDEIDSGEISGKSCDATQDVRPYLYDTNTGKVDSLTEEFKEETSCDYICEKTKTRYKKVVKTVTYMESLEDGSITDITEGLPEGITESGCKDE